MTVQNRTIAKAFALWGNKHAALAGAMGVTPGCARQWMLRGYVPVRYWSEFIEIMAAAHQKTITYRDLAEAKLGNKEHVRRQVRQEQAAA